MVTSLWLIAVTPVLALATVAPGGGEPTPIPPAARTTAWTGPGAPNSLTERPMPTWNPPSPGGCTCDWKSFTSQRDLHKPTNSTGTTIARTFVQIGVFVSMGIGIVYVSRQDRWMGAATVGSIVGTAFGLSWYGVESFGDTSAERQRELAEFDFCFSRCPLEPPPAK